MIKSIFNESTIDEILILAENGVEFIINDGYIVSVTKIFDK